MDQTFIQERITATKAQIIAYENAALALADNNTQSYKLDTGQTITWVTRLDLDQIQKTIDGLYNRCATLEARLTGSGSVTVVPAW